MSSGGAGFSSVFAGLEMACVSRFLENVTAAMLLHKILPSRKGLPSSFLLSLSVVEQFSRLLESSLISVVIDFFLGSDFLLSVWD